MKTYIRGWLAAIALALFSLALPVQAQLAAGKDYIVIEPALGSDNPASIEVIEFFSYGCPHCSDLHTPIGKWAARLPADVAFKRVPVGFGNPYYQNLAKLYYALEAIGELQKLDSSIDQMYSLSVPGRWMAFSPPTTAIPTVIPLRILFGIINAGGENAIQRRFY